MDRAATTSAVVAGAERAHRARLRASMASRMASLLRRRPGAGAEQSGNMLMGCRDDVCPQVCSQLYTQDRAEIMQLN